MNTHKLALNVETLRTLNAVEAGHVAGGGVSYNIICDTNERTMCHCATFSHAKACQDL